MKISIRLAIGLQFITGAAIAFAPSNFLALDSSAQQITHRSTVLNSQSLTSSTRLFASESSSDGSYVQDMGSVGFVLLAGGTGSRMKANMPKQFLTLKGMPVLHHSLDLFLNRLPAFCESHGMKGPPLVVVVMDPMYQPEYQPIVDKYEGRLLFANPGVERQGSVENGVKKIKETLKDKCTHVAARPLVTIEEICNVVKDAKEYGAAVLGVPCKATIKESEDGKMVLRTIPRARLWEVHTPQVIEIDNLLKGFEKVEAEGLEVTDDVSIIEAMAGDVKLTKGEYTNLKITTPEDMDVATAILEERKMKVVDLLE
jgi:2-C-methyl-D-erythritol 4-phosphate cytidylyltransferase